MHKVIAKLQDQVHYKTKLSTKLQSTKNYATSTVVQAVVCSIHMWLVFVQKSTLYIVSRVSVVPLLFSEQTIQ